MSWDEDAAYRRLLDVYYTLEKPIPEDRVYRLVVAVSKVQRQAVDSVLNDFFKQTPEGWLHERCEAELDAMRVKQSAQEDKDRHETDRMRRYRERRSSMFEALRLVEIVPAWDVPMKELQRLFDTNCNAPVTPPATDLQREQVVAGVTPATAISTNTNTNTNNKNTCSDLLAESELVSEFSIPLVDGTDFRVAERLVAEWRSAYPAVDVPQELREMRTWAMANRAKRKTRNGVERFAVAWLGKAQDTPSRAVGQRATGNDWTAAAQ